MKIEKIKKYFILLNKQTSKIHREG